MFNLLGKIPTEPFYVAVSGGKDSMTILSFLRKYPKNKFELLYFNHGTEHGQEAEEFLIKFCEREKLTLNIGRISKEKPKGQSPEQFWRDQRYEFFDSFNGTIITCHHLGDVIETWIFTALRGHPKLIPHVRGKYLRPFLKVTKSQIDGWAKKNKVEYIEDPSNATLKYSRNKIRHQIVPLALTVNPGLETTLRNLLDKPLEIC